MRAIKGSFLLLLASLLLAPPAVAGGWWSGIGLEGQPVGLGESIDLKVSEVMFDSIEEAQEARGQDFFAYLVEDFDQTALDEAMTRADPGDWWRPLSEPIHAGTVELIGWDANLAKGRVELDVPQIPLGTYYLMLCDAGCDVALGNLLPSQVDVTAGVLAAQTVRRLDEAEADLGLALHRARSDARQTRSALRQTRSHDAGQDERIRKLGAKLVEAKKPESAPWITYAGWFVAGLAVAFLFLRRDRPKSSRGGLEMEIERIPDDPRELIDAH